jgi:hypothetical protein
MDLREFGWGDIQGGSNMTGTNCDLFTHNHSRSYLNHLVDWILLAQDRNRQRAPMNAEMNLRVP